MLVLGFLLLSSTSAFSEGSQEVLQRYLANDPQGWTDLQERYGTAVAEQVRRSVFSLETCSGTAISPTLLLTAGHCYEDGDEKEFRATTIDAPEDKVELSLFFRTFDEKSKDLMVLKRTEGTFENFIPIDVRFDASIAPSGDQYLVAGFPMVTRMEEVLERSAFTDPAHALYVSTVRGSPRLATYGDFAIMAITAEFGHMWPDPRAKEILQWEADLRNENPWKGFIVESLTFSGSSGGPLLRIHQGAKGNQLTIVGVLRGGMVMDESDPRLSSVSWIVDLAPLQSSRKGEIRRLLQPSR